MPERTVEEIRQEIAAERQELASDLAALRYSLRWYALIPVVVALARRKPAATLVRTGLRATRKLI